MTIATQLREIAYRLPMVPGRIWDREPLLKIADELDAKAKCILNVYMNLDAAGDKDTTEQLKELTASIGNSQS